MAGSRVGGCVLNLFNTLVGKPRGGIKTIAAKNQFCVREDFGNRRALTLLTEAIIFASLFARRDAQSFRFLDFYSDYWTAGVDVSR
jgi:hypothetical protein